MKYIIFLFVSLCLIVCINAEDLTLLEDTFGRKLECKIISKNASVVQVIDTGGRKFEIPLSKLNEESKLLVLEFADTSLELYKLLTQKEIIVQKGIDFDKNKMRLL